MAAKRRLSRQATSVTFASGGRHTIRVQVREDGAQIDQIVLSPSRYLLSPPARSRTMRRSSASPDGLNGLETSFGVVRSSAPGSHVALFCETPPDLILRICETPPDLIGLTHQNPRAAAADGT
jgi:hypothetical protein